MIPVLWRAAPFLAVDKPAGLPVFPPHGDPGGDCVAARIPDTGLPWPEGYAGGIAHRLDTATSGQLLVAETLDALATLRGWFADGALDKRYLFLAAREVPWDENLVTRRIAHDRHHRGRVVVERGRATPHRGRWREAETRLRRLGSVGPGLWAWEAWIRTGVTHQVRAHAAAAGIPLAGDRRYGGGPLDLDRPAGADFLLHHAGAVGPAFAPTPAPLPAWWPALP